MARRKVPTKPLQNLRRAFFQWFRRDVAEQAFAKQLTPDEIAAYTEQVIEQNMLPEGYTAEGFRNDAHKASWIAQYIIAGNLEYPVK